MRAHVIENGIVTNTIEVESLDFMPNLISGETGGIGWLWDGKTLTPPVITPVVPQTVTMSQARKALVLSGISIAAVDSSIAAIVDPIERQTVEIDWEYSTNVRRDSPLVSSLSPVLNLTEIQVDDLFILANSL